MTLSDACSFTYAMESYGGVVMDGEGCGGRRKGGRRRGVPLDSESILDRIPFRKPVFRSSVSMEGVSTVNSSHFLPVMGVPDGRPFLPYSVLRTLVSIPYSSMLSVV